jgi:hypothetical protein
MIVDDRGPRTAPFSGPATLEVLIRRQVSATLTFVDCTGSVLPALAERWHPAADGHAWTFTLRQGLQFPDGAPIDATALREAWLATAGDSTRWPGVVDVAVTTPREIRIAFAIPHLDPALFDDPALAFLGPPAGAGSGPGLWRLTSPPGQDAAGRFRAELVGQAGTLDRVRLEVEAVPGRDIRDILDLPDSSVATVGTMVLTRSTAAAAYARQLPHWRVVPLAWDAVHLLMVPGKGGPGPDSTARLSLAREALPGEARAAGAQGWWDTVTDCRESPAQMLPVGRRLAYVEGDPVGRGLAERIVSLAESGRPPDWLASPLRRAPGEAARLTAVGMTPEALRSALAAGTLTGAVVGLPRLRPASCEAVLVRVAGLREVPLVETRGYLLLRGPVPELVLDSRGSLLIGVPR